MAQVAGEVVAAAARRLLHGRSVDWDLLASYAGLLGLAVLSIYVGAHASLPRRSKRDPVPEDKGKGNDKGKGDPNDDDEDEDEDDTERMSAEDAWLFPIVGSVVLVGLYLVVQHLGEKWINRLLGWYFAITGVGSVWNSLVVLTRHLAGETRWKGFDRLRVRVTKGSHVIASVATRTPTMVLLPLALVPSGLYTFSAAGRRSVLLTDVLGLSFAHNAVALLKLDSFRTGAILLAGLFVYDVWWVFGTEVMVKVATTLDVPIKLLWPKSAVFGSARGYTMLGLGDIVIPGTFVAVALRYDAEGKRAGKPFFWAAMVGYIVGLITTMIVMHGFGAAQPALLYLSPACIGSFVGTGLARGELVAAWRWKDGPE